MFMKSKIVLCALVMSCGVTVIDAMKRPAGPWRNTYVSGSGKKILCSPDDEGTRAIRDIRTGKCIKRILAPWKRLANEWNAESAADEKKMWQQKKKLSEALCGLQKTDVIVSFKSDAE